MEIVEIVKTFGKGVIDLIRAAVRPAVALTAAFGTLALLILRIPIPGEWWLFVGSVTTFYFVHRHEEKKIGP